MKIPMCPLGFQPYKTKREAQDAHPDEVVARCHHCRYWHGNPKLSKRAAKRGRRRN